MRANERDGTTRTTDVRGNEVTAQCHAPALLHVTVHPHEPTEALRAIEIRVGAQPRKGSTPLDGRDNGGHATGLEKSYRLEKSHMETMDNLAGRYAALTARVVDGVLTKPGQAPVELRRAVFARAARLGGSGPEDVPPALAVYVDKVARHAYRVTDEDLATLQRAGHSDDALFEVTVSAALGAALGRLERGLAALCGT